MRHAFRGPWAPIVLCTLALFHTPQLGAQTEAATDETAPSEAATEDGWTTEWKNGTRIESGDGQFALKFGGRIQVDFSFPDPDEALEPLGFEDRAGFRRARLFFSGTLYGNVEFKIQYDFVGGEAAPKDVYLGLTDLPVVGNLRIGHFKEPFSLDELTSSKYGTFVERSLPSLLFAPARNIGLMAHDQAMDDRLTWAVGGFRDTDSDGNTVGEDWNFTGRVTGLPIASDDGPLLHVGLALSQRSPADDVVSFRPRPGSGLIPRLDDTGGLTVFGLDLLGLESAFVHGPFWAAAEAYRAELDEPTDATFDGWHVEAGWFLTGERRPFKKSEAVFDRVRPGRNFSRGQGPGAWEIALRYSDSDLTDVASGFAIDGVTAAVNWYLNPATRVMLNLNRSDLDDAGSLDVAVLRFAIDF